MDLHGSSKQASIGQHSDKIISSKPCLDLSVSSFLVEGNFELIAPKRKNKTKSNVKKKKSKVIMFKQFN